MFISSCTVARLQSKAANPLDSAESAGQNSGDLAIFRRRCFERVYFAVMCLREPEVRVTQLSVR